MHMQPFFVIVKYGKRITDLKTGKLVVCEYALVDEHDEQRGGGVEQGSQNASTNSVMLRLAAKDPSLCQRSINVHWKDLLLVLVLQRSLIHNRISHIFKIEVENES